MKKTILNTLLILLCTALVSAQVPGKFNYQAVIRNVNGAPITTGTVDIIFELYEDNAGATKVFQENFNNQPVSNLGVVNLQVGGSPITSGTLKQLKDLNWSSKNYFVKIQVNGNSISGNVLPQLVSVPYALFADTAKYALNASQVIYTAGSGIAINGNSISANDASDLNEIQTLSLNGDTLSLSKNGGSITLNFSVNNNQLQLNGTDILPLSSLTPAGTIVAYGGTVAPPGWFICDGGTRSRATYAALFAAIGTNFGVGDGTTTFNIPETRGYFLRGVLGNGGADPDMATRTPNGNNLKNAPGSMQGDAFASHSHVISTQDNGSGGGGGKFIGTGGSGGSTQTTGSSTETRPKNVYVNYIIKY